MAVFPAPRFSLRRLVALEDGQGLTRALGIVRDLDRSAGTVTLQTPLNSLDDIEALTLGDVSLDPETFQDARLPRSN
jgi:polynucleotide 5'-kinase involved in rRNA processing